MRNFEAASQQTITVSSYACCRVDQDPGSDIRAEDGRTAASFHRLDFAEARLRPGAGATCLTVGTTDLKRTIRNTVQKYGVRVGFETATRRFVRDEFLFERDHD
ncbi:hypothetical protein EVAR_53139_1 [Eumeta japonica]|uniref:Uncharacterized protein n=1 Tax=Eumeta variegata TaxID=151549 RepID=A0A4C1YEC5_EUMVA|nr:hypothetical protein EVAR_53139_1 [Eumeta japonica]